MTLSTDLTRRILLLSDEQTKLFRNNVGHGWQGADFTIRGGRLVGGVARNTAFGLAVDSHDIIGLKAITITPDMVGRTVPVFVSIEAKVGRDRLTAGQRSFLDMIKGCGGLTGVARCVEDAEDILHGQVGR